MTTKRLTPVQAIKQYCRYSCCANDTISWKECSIVKCALFPYHLGKRPKRLPFEEYARKHTDLTTKSQKNEILQEVTNG